MILSDVKVLSDNMFNDSGQPFLANNLARRLGFVAGNLLTSTLRMGHGWYRVNITNLIIYYQQGKIINYDYK